MTGQPRYAGVYPILYAFHREGGGFDREAMKLQVDRCIAAGAHGIALLGLITEVNKLDTQERLELVEMVGGFIAGRVPFAVTVAEPSVHGQVAFCRQVRKLGADWVILQPPPVKGVGEADIVRFFGTVADALDFPVAIQNNPIDLDVSLTNEGMLTLYRNHPNMQLLKGEGAAVHVASLIEASGGGFDVFSGYGGLELLTTLRSGAAGVIPAPDCMDVQVRIFELMRSGDPEQVAEAERLHRSVLPMIVFMTQSLASMLTYGKRLIARRLGLPEPVDRAPAPQPTAFGLAEMERFAEELGPLGAG